MILIVLILSAISIASAADGDGGPDDYRWRVTGNWWLPNPSGYFGLQNGNNYFNVNKDFGFGRYSTFTGKVDYRFRWKHHILFDISPISDSRTVAIARTIQFQGQTFDIGAQVAATIKSLNIAPGYEYDIVRKNQWFLGLEADLNLLDTKGTLEAAGTANNLLAGKSASKSFFAPLPAVGPIGRWYPLHDSNRLSLEGSVRAMSFFGYGDFIAARGSVGVGITQHLAFRGGYQMGSRLSVHGTSNDIKVRLTQKGPTAGIEYSWGEIPPPAPKAQPSPYLVSDWHVNWIPLYLWFSGLHGNVGALGYTAPVSLSVSDILSNLNIGMMSALDVRRKRIGLLTDLVFISLTADQKTTPVGSLYSGFTANSKTFFLDTEGYVRLLDGQISIDALAGARTWRLNNSIDLLSGGNTAATAGQTQSWVDPVLGARFRLNFLKGWFATLKGDAGGFGVGSQVTWQIVTLAGKEVGDRYSMMAGYRYLDVDYQSGGFLDNTHMSGPIVGFNIRFK
ncbi:MAG TPA: hypothetical protein VF753_03275 [Terriglobales bacterium]